MMPYIYELGLYERELLQEPTAVRWKWCEDLFWKSLFARLNACPVGLARLRPEHVEKQLNLFGYIII